MRLGALRRDIRDLIGLLRRALPLLQRTAYPPAELIDPKFHRQFVVPDPLREQAEPPAERQWLADLMEAASKCIVEGDAWTPATRGLVAPPMPALENLQNVRRRIEREMKESEAA